MAIEASRVRFEPVNIRGNWQVRVTYPSGLSEYISGFKNRWAADDWIGSSLQLEWLRARGFEF
jgi:hypothetical protein